MTGPHFKEVVEVVCKTTNLNKTTIADVLDISTTTLSYWQRFGVPGYKTALVMNRLKVFLFDVMGER